MVDKNGCRPELDEFSDQVDIKITPVFLFAFLGDAFPFVRFWIVKRIGELKIVPKLAT